MQTCFLPIVFGIVVFFAGFCPSMVSGAEREVFLYGSGDSTEALVHDSADRWVEIVGVRETFHVP